MKPIVFKKVVLTMTLEGGGGGDIAIIDYFPKLVQGVYYSLISVHWGIQKVAKLHILFRGEGGGRRDTKDWPRE